MTLFQAKELLKSHSIAFSETELASEADFLNHFSQSTHTKKTKEHEFCALTVQSNNEKKHIELLFKEKNGEYVFWDLFFGEFSFEYFSDDADDDCSYLVEEIQEIMKGYRVFIVVTNPRIKRWTADAQFDRSDSIDEINFQKAMKRIRKKRTLREILFGSIFKFCYEIYDWNTYERIIK